MNDKARCDNACCWRVLKLALYGRTCTQHANMHNSSMHAAAADAVAGGAEHQYGDDAVLTAGLRQHQDHLQSAHRNPLQ